MTREKWHLETLEPKKHPLVLAFYCEELVPCIPAGEWKRKVTREIARTVRRYGFDLRVPTADELQFATEISSFPAGFADCVRDAHQSSGDLVLPPMALQRGLNVMSKDLGFVFRSWTAVSIKPIARSISSRLTWLASDTNWTLNNKLRMAVVTDLVRWLEAGDWKRLRYCIQCKNVYVGRSDAQHCGRRKCRRDHDRDLKRG